ncbi:MAG: hypothetical protein NZ551_06200 [Microscillaceae bacterium]|nr:hypothetical protein [Microscillaceae bacterium]MDW8460786.1 hypothetical protein [Cytophagales bacterium]
MCAVKTEKRFLVEGMLAKVFKYFYAGILVLLFVGSIAFFLYSLQSRANRLLSWDEVHYLEALKKGFWANWTESQTTNFIQFAQYSWAKACKDSVQIAQIIQKLPTEEQDLHILRHFHPVLPIYIWLLIYQISPSHWVEIQSFLLLILLLGLICLYLQTWELRIIVASLLLTSNYLNETYQIANFHSFFSVVGLFFFYCLQKYLLHKDVKNRILLAFSIACLILTLETYIFLIAFSASSYIMNWFIRQKSTVFRSYFQEVIQILALVVVFISILQIGFWRSGGSFKSWAYYVYRIFFAQNDDYQTVSWIGVLQHFALNHLVFSICLVIISVVFLQKNKEVSLHIQVMLMTYTAYLFLIAIFTVHTSYLVPALVGLAVGCGQIIEQNKLNLQLKTGVAISILCELAWHFYYYPFQKTLQQNQQAQQDMAFVIRLAQSVAYPILADGNHVFNFYAQSQQFKQLRTMSLLHPDFYERIHYRNFNRRHNIQQKEYAAVILLKEMRNYTTKDFNFLINAGYHLVELQDYRCFIRKDLLRD